MKITKSQLRNIIKEELGRVLSEAISTPMPENYKSMGFFPDDIGGTSMPEIYAPPNYEQMMMKGQDFKVYLQDRKTKEFVNTRDGNFFTIDGQAVKRNWREGAYESADICSSKSRGNLLTCKLL